MMSVQVKICGTTSVADARLSQEAGADFLGVMLYHPPSPRNISMDVAREIQRASRVPLVLLTVNQTLPILLQLGSKFPIRALQLHGDESPELVEQLVAKGFNVWKAISGDAASLSAAAKTYTDAGAEAILVDARAVSASGIVYGGTGHLADWSAARQLVDDGYRVILAGGLAPENVGLAIQTVQPWIVDVVSGVEERKGKKNTNKVNDFVRQAKSGVTVS